MIVADTDVLVDYLRGAGPGAAVVRRDLRAGVLATTAISAFELWAGARSERDRASVRKLLAALEVLPFDGQAAERAGAVRRALQAEGRDIGMADSLIAGLCLRRRAALLTRNRRHFERVERLRLVDLES